MSMEPQERLVRIRSVADSLRELELDDSEIAKLLGTVGLADSRILESLGTLSDQVNAWGSTLTDLVNSWGQQILESIVGRPAVSAQLTLVNQQGDPVPSAITVDTVGEALVLQFVDDKGDTDAAPPTAADGTPAVITYSSSDPAVLTIDDTGAITVVGEGSADASVSIADATGNPIMEADGTTPFNPPAVTITVAAGAAVGARLSVNP